MAPVEVEGRYPNRGYVCSRWMSRGGCGSVTRLVQSILLTHFFTGRFTRTSERRNVRRTRRRSAQGQRVEHLERWMCQKFTRQQSGDGFRVVVARADYLLGERDAARHPSEGSEVVCGDPDMVAAIVDTLEFEHKYTSGVIAWSTPNPS